MKATPEQFSVPRFPLRTGFGNEKYSHLETRTNSGNSSGLKNQGHGFQPKMSRYLFLYRTLELM